METINNIDMRKSLNYSLLIALFVGFLQVLEAQKPAQIYLDYLKNPVKSILADFSFAGYHYGENAIPDLPVRVNVKDRGILPDTQKDLTQSIQKVIDEVGQSGGGVIYFPKGRYCVNMDTMHVSFLTIDYDNVVLRGESNSPDGTVIYNGSTLIQEKINPWISPSVIRFGYKIQPTDLFWGISPLNPIVRFEKSGSAADPGSDGTIRKAPVLTRITKNSLKGSRELHVSDIQRIKAGDVILVGMFNTSADGNLIQDILSYKPQDITPDLTVASNAGVEKAPSFQHLLEVESVRKPDIVILKQPLRRDILLKYKPVIASAPMIREVGIENIRFESAWDGTYLHHGGGKYSPKLSMIMDYGWNAVNFCRVAHGWMRNVTIDNYTNPVYLQDCRNVTIENIITSGHNGHCGVKLYAHAADNLIRNIRFESNYTHILSCEGNVYGNVFSRINYTFRDSLPGNFDFHGFAHRSYSPPAWNLFELTTGMCRINGGGAGFNMPHTARFNIWWNITAHGIDRPTELFNHGYWTGKGITTGHYKMYPGSIIVGYRSDNKPLLIDQTDNDRSDPLLYVEDLNKGPVYPLSLYEKQLEYRLKSKKSTTCQ